MDKDFLENRTFDEIEVGDSGTLTRTLTERDIQVFAIMSGDINPAHVDEEYAQSEMFHKIIGHGMWGGALISTVLGTQLPGPGTIYINQSLKFRKPVAIGDTLTVTVTAKEKKPEKKRITFACECKNQQGEVVMDGEAEVIAPSKKIRRPKAELPRITLRRSKSLFDEYVERARKIGSLPAAVINPFHGKILEAVLHAHTAGMIDPILIGPRERIRRAAQNANLDIRRFEILDVDNSHAATMRAIHLAREGEVGIIVRGGAILDELLRAMKSPEKGIMTERHLSSVTLLDVPTYHKPLLLTDNLIHMDPSLDIKREITQNAIDFAMALEINTPKVAIVAGVDTINTHMKSTIDAAALCKMAERNQIQSGILDGPLTFDAVISQEVALRKGVASPVIGDADIMVMPNVETATILVKQLESLAESRHASLVIGGKVPVLTSHIHDVNLSTASCALAILDNHYRQRLAEYQPKGEVYGQGD